MNPYDVSPEMLEWRRAVYEANRVACNDFVRRMADINHGGIRDNNGMFLYCFKRGHIYITDPFLDESGSNRIEPDKYYGDDFLKSIFGERATDFADRYLVKSESK